jgi:micrococcal nuclease
MKNNFKIKILTVFSVFMLLLTVKTAFTGQEEMFFFRSTEQYQEIEVEKVLGPTLLRLKGGELVRLIGVKGPEVRLKRTTVERDKFGFPVEEEPDPQSTVEERGLEFMRGLAEGKKVRLEFDISKRGTDGKTLAYAYLVEDGTFLNIEILRMGFANLSIEPPNIKYADLFREAYREARREQRGFLSD